MTKRVLILNHMAVSKGEAGHTRHVELFDLLQNQWEYTLLAADRDLFSRKRTHRSRANYRTIWTTPYRGNGLDRVINWASFAVGATLRGLLQRRVDVVFASSPHLLAGLAGLVVARIRRAGLVLEIRDLWPQILLDMKRVSSDSLAYRSLRRLERLLYRNADEIVVLAEGSIEAIQQDCPATTPITFIPNGADLSLFEIAESRLELRRRLGIHGLAFVYTGAHGPANGLQLLLKAAAAIQRDLPRVQFMLVGDGLDKRKLITYAEASGLSNVEFRDPVPRTEIPALLKAADVGIHVLADIPLFKYGVSPNKIFDYMAAGLPIVTNCPGEVADLVKAAKGGLAAGPRELEQAIRTMAEATDEERSRWGLQGRDYVRQFRSRQALAVELSVVLERALRR